MRQNNNILEMERFLMEKNFNSGIYSNFIEIYTFTDYDIGDLKNVIDLCGNDQDRLMLLIDMLHKNIDIPVIVPVIKNDYPVYVINALKDIVYKKLPDTIFELFCDKTLTEKQVKLLMILLQNSTSTLSFLKMIKESKIESVDLINSCVRIEKKSELSLPTLLSMFSEIKDQDVFKFLEQSIIDGLSIDELENLKQFNTLKQLEIAYDELIRLRVRNFK